MTKNAFKILGGLIDFGVLGSGDGHMAFALIGEVEQSLCYDYTNYHPNYLSLLRQWQSRASAFLENKRIGYADCSIKHYFHGYREDRRYVQRMEILINHQFDPINDIMYDDSNLIVWKDGKELLKDEVKSYFDNRKEDITENNSKKLLSCNLPPKTVDEILQNGEKLKTRIEENEKFKKLIDNFAPKSEKENQKKRSKSAKHQKKIAKPKNKKKRDNPRNKKLEMWIQFGLDDNDSEQSISTDNNDDDLINNWDFSMIDSLSPNGSFDNQTDLE